MPLQDSRARRKAHLQTARFRTKVMGALDVLHVLLHLGIGSRFCESPPPHSIPWCALLALRALRVLHTQASGPCAVHDAQAVEEVVVGGFTGTVHDLTSGTQFWVNLLATLGFAQESFVSDFENIGVYTYFDLTFLC